MLTFHERETLIWGASLQKTEKFVLFALNKFADANGECWPGQERISYMTEMTIKTVREAFKRLEDKGIIARNPRYKYGHRTSDEYKVDFSRVTLIQKPPFKEVKITGIDEVKQVKITGSKQVKITQELSSIELSRSIKERSVVLSDDSHFSQEPTAVVEPEPMEILVTATALRDGQLEKPKKGRTRQDVPPRRGFDHEAWIETYNSNKPAKWPGIKDLKAAPRQKAVKAAIKSCDNEQDALSRFSAALQHVCTGGESTKFWREQCTGGFETLIRPTKQHFIALAEAGNARQQLVTADPATRHAPVAIDIPAHVHQMPWQQQQDWMAEQRRQISEGTWQAPQKPTPTEDIPANPERLTELMGGLAA